MYAKQFLKATGEAKKKDTATVLSEATKGTFTGAAIGATIGMFIGFGRGKSLLLSGFIGAAIGGAVSKVFIK